MHTTHNTLLQKARRLQARPIQVATFGGESYLLQGLFVMLGICVASYLYFVGLSIMNVIANREASVETERLRSTVSSLEEDYFTLSKDVTADVGSYIGLTATADSSFVRRTSGMAMNVRPSTF